MIGSERGRPWTPLSAVCIPSAGSARTIRMPADATAETAGRLSTRARTAPHRCDSPWLRWRRRATNGTRPFSTLSPSLESSAGSTVSEPTTATATTRIVPTANDSNTLLPARNMPAMAIITVIPEDQDGATGRGRGDLQGRLRLQAGVALLHLAAQVEHRVVDAHRQADQQHDGADRLLDRDQLADRAQQSERGEHRGQREQQWQARGDQRPERDDEDEQRDRQRQILGLLEVVVEGLRERLVGAGVAELLDPQLRVGLLGGGHGRLGGVDPIAGQVVVAGDLERDERRAA